MIAVVDFGLGNIVSLVNALKQVGGNAKIVTTASELRDARKIVLPGVGGFATAMEKLSR